MTDGIVITRMDGFQRDVRDEAAAVFVDGFYDQLCFFSRDRDKLKAAFAPCFRPDRFYIAELGGRIAGILGCTGSPDRAMPLDRGALRPALGFFKGGFVYRFLKSEFNTPLTYKKGVAYIECVATLEEFRGRGVCTALLSHVLRELPYYRYVLEVTDTNDKARLLYEKLGFREFERKTEAHPEYTGFSERIYMEWRRPAAGEQAEQ